MYHNQQIITIFEQLKALGLEQYSFKRKTKTGVHAFIDNRTGEKYITYSNGYVRRELTRDTMPGRIAPINKRVEINKGKYLNSSYKQYKPVLLYSEISRLQFLVDYMKKKNEKIKKNGTKYYGQPVPKWIARQEYDKKMRSQLNRTNETQTAMDHLNRIARYTQSIKDVITRYQLDGTVPDRTRAFNEVREHLEPGFKWSEIEFMGMLSLKARKLK